METSNHLDSLKAMVSCSVCYAVLTEEPCVLPCFHNLCLKDREELPEAEVGGYKGVRCPICDTFAKNATSGNADLMKQLVEVYTKVSEGRYECAQCKAMGARWRCIDCKVDLCDTCQDGHQNITVCRGHKTVRHEECDPGQLPKIDTFVYCEKHPAKEIEFNCTDCEKTMCYKCYVLKHSQHKCESIEDATERILPKVKENSSKLQARSQLYRDEVEKFQQQAANISSNVEHVKEDMKRERDQLIAKIKQETEQKMQQLEAEKQTRLLRVNKSREQLEYAAANLESLTSWSKNVLQNTAGASLLQELQQSLVPSLSKMADEPTTVPNLDTAMTSFAPAQLWQKKESLIGKVATKDE